MLVFVGSRRNNPGWVDYEFNYRAAGVDKKVSILSKNVCVGLLLQHAKTQKCVSVLYQLKMSYYYDCSQFLRSHSEKH